MELAFCQGIVTGMSGKTVVFKEQNMYSPVLIDNLLHHSECVCTMSTYNNVRMACINCENTVWGWECVSAAWLGVLQSEGNVEEFYIACRVVTLHHWGCWLTQTV